MPPSDGIWIDTDGVEHYIYGSYEDSSIYPLAEVMGYTPSDFGGEIWAQVDEDLVRAVLPIQR